MAANLGLKSNVSKCDGPPAIVSQITRRTRGGWCAGRTPAGAPAALARIHAGSSNVANATAPSVRPARPKNTRRVWCCAAHCRHGP